MISWTLALWFEKCAHHHCLVGRYPFHTEVKMSIWLFLAVFYSDVIQTSHCLRWATQLSSQMTSEYSDSSSTSLFLQYITNEIHPLVNTQEDYLNHGIISFLENHNYMRRNMIQMQYFHMQNSDARKWVASHYHS